MGDERLAFEKERWRLLEFLRLAEDRRIKERTLCEIEFERLEQQIYAEREAFARERYRAEVRSASEWRAGDQELREKWEKKLERAWEKERNTALEAWNAKMDQKQAAQQRKQAVLREIA